MSITSFTFRIAKRYYFPTKFYEKYFCGFKCLERNAQTFLGSPLEVVI